MDLILNHNFKPKHNNNYYYKKYMSDTNQGKVKGVADIVFLMDATQSMEPCINALKNNIKAFIESLSTGNNSQCLKDWRLKTVGYRDFQSDGANWFSDNSFTRDPNEAYQQLDRLEADGGGDIPESLLDALYKVATMESSEKGQPDSSDKWRYRSEAVRFVIIFTDAPYHETMSIPEAAGGSVEDIKRVLPQQRIRTVVFAPHFPCYDELDKCNNMESNFYTDTSSATSAQEALAEYTQNEENFRSTLEQLARTLTQTAGDVTLID